jgi:hypothetical protein
MGSGDVTSRDAVLRAIEEFDQIGREAFLAKYRFHPSRKFIVVHEGRQYDSKPLLAAAHGFQYPDQGPLRTYHFSGGYPTTSRLRALGFTIQGPADTAPTVSFDREDCAVFARYPKRVPWTPDNVSLADQERFKDIWERLKQLVGWLAGQTGIDVPVRAFTSRSRQMGSRRRISGAACIRQRCLTSLTLSRSHSSSRRAVLSFVSALGRVNPRSKVPSWSRLGRRCSTCKGGWRLCRPM